MSSDNPSESSESYNHDQERATRRAQHSRLRRISQQ